MDQQGIDNLEGHLTTDTDDHYGEIGEAIEAIVNGPELRELCSLFSMSMIYDL